MYQMGPDPQREGSLKGGHVSDTLLDSGRVQSSRPLVATQLIACTGLTILTVTGMIEEVDCRTSTFLFVLHGQLCD